MSYYFYSFLLYFNLINYLFYLKNKNKNNLFKFYYILILFLINKKMLFNGKYEKIERLKSGGYGTIYKVQEKKNKKKYALNSWEINLTLKKK